MVLVCVLPKSDAGRGEVEASSSLEKVEGVLN